MVHPGQRPCQGCGTLFEISTRERNRRRWCSEACRVAAYRRRTAEECPTAPEATERECPECGLKFMAAGWRLICGSAECARGRANASRREKKSYLKGTRIRRAQTRGPGAEQIDRFAVADRDGWVCQLCDAPIPLVVLWPHPLAFTIDHAVPLVAGGPHTWANVQASHFACNQAKGVTVAS